MIPYFIRFNYPTEKNFLLIPKFTLRSIGFYPETPNTFWLKLWAALNFISLAYSCFAELQYGIHFFSIDSAKAMDAFCPMACSLTTLFKIACIWYYRNEFNFLINRIRELLNEQKSIEKSKIKCFYHSLATRLNSWLFFLATATTIGYSLRPIVVNVISYFHGKEYIYDTGFKLLFPDVLVKMPYYPFTYIFTVWYGQITAAGFNGTDGIFLAFCFYFAILLKCLQLDVKDLLRERNENLNHFLSDQKKMKNIIERHCEIAVLIERFSNIVSGFTLVHFVSSSVVIGTSVVCFFLYSDLNVLVYVSYTLGVVTELFFYCLGGTAVAENALELGSEAYCSSWFTQDLRIQKMVLMLILRSQRPMVIRVPFFAPTLMAFISILRFTGSLVALAIEFL